MKATKVAGQSRAGRCQRTMARAAAGAHRHRAPGKAISQVFSICAGRAWYARPRAAARPLHGSPGGIMTTLTCAWPSDSRGLTAALGQAGMGLAAEQGGLRERLRAAIAQQGGWID